MTLIQKFAILTARYLNTVLKRRTPLFIVKTEKVGLYKMYESKMKSEMTDHLYEAILSLKDEEVC